MNRQSSDSAVIVALDFPTYTLAMACAEKIDPSKCRAMKVGMELFTAAGPAVVRNLMELGFDVFLDLKYHDIPNTVAGAVRAAMGLGVWMLNVHADGGGKMMRAAVDAAQEKAAKSPIIIGVTVLTSMESGDLVEVGVRAPLGTTLPQVLRLAQLAKDSGLNGVVCSGQEAGPVRQAMGKDFVIVTPGIRLPEGNKDDQARITTPEKAIMDGANYLVVGRPITGAPDQMVALANINDRARSARMQMG